MTKNTVGLLGGVFWVSRDGRDEATAGLAFLFKCFSVQVSSNEEDLQRAWPSKQIQQQQQQQQRTNG